MQCSGASPKPADVPISDWSTIDDGDYTSAYLDELAAAGDNVEGILDRATVDVVRAQVDAGIDVPTDGEIRRENYIHYQCRHLGGIDFDAIPKVVQFNKRDLPDVKPLQAIKDAWAVSPPSPRWRFAARACGRPSGSCSGSSIARSTSVTALARSSASPRKIS